MPTAIFLFDAESGQLRVRIPIPDVTADRLIAPQGPAPLLAFDAESRLLAVATTKSLSLFSVPEGTPLVSEALPELDNTPPVNPARREATRSSRCPPASSSPGGQTGCSRPPIRRTSRFPGGFPIGGSSASAKLVEQVVLSWDVTLPRTRIEDHRHDGIVRAIKLDPRDRFVTAAGDDRMIRVWDRGGGLRWSVGYPGAGSLFSHTVSMPGEHTSWLSGNFDPTGAVFFTRIHDRIDVWDATSGGRRGSFTSVLAISPDNRYLVVTGGEGPPPARELRILDVSRNASVLSIPLEQNSPIDVVRRARVQGLGRGHTLPSSQVQPRLAVLRRGWARQTRAGGEELDPADRRPGRGAGRRPAPERLTMGHRTRGQGARREQHGGRQARCSAPMHSPPAVKSVSPPAPPSPWRVSPDLSSWIAPDDRRMAVPIWKGTGPQAELKYFVWQFDKDQTDTNRWELDSARSNWYQDEWTYFDASGTRLLISGWQKTGGPRRQRHVIELWDLTGPKRLMSTADAAPELPIVPPRLLFNPRQRAFATFHDPQKNPDGIGAIVWETATGKVIGRYKGSISLCLVWSLQEMVITSSSTTRARARDLAQDRRGPRDSWELSLLLFWGSRALYGRIRGHDRTQEGGSRAPRQCHLDGPGDRSDASRSSWSRGVVWGLHPGRQAARDLSRRHARAERLGGRDRQAAPVRPIAPRVRFERR